MAKMLYRKAPSTQQHEKVPCGSIRRHNCATWASWPLETPGKGQEGSQIISHPCMTTTSSSGGSETMALSEDQHYSHLSRHPYRAPSLFPWPRYRHHLTEEPVRDLVQLCIRRSSVRNVPRDRARRRLCRRTVVVGDDWLEVAKRKEAEGPLTLVPPPAGGLMHVRRLAIRRLNHINKLKTVRLPTKLRVRVSSAQQLVLQSDFPTRRP